MKKLVILFSVLLVASAFAFEPKFSGTVVETIGSNGDNVLGAPGANTSGKSRIVLNGKISDATSLVWIFDPSLAAGVDYIWIDSKIDLGKLRFGIQRLGIANYGGGIYQTNTFCGQTDGNFKGVGVALYSNMAGIDYNIYFNGGYKDSTAKLLGLYAKTKLDTLNIGVYGVYKMAAVVASATPKSGIAAGLDIDTKIADISLAGQAYMEASDDSGLVMTGTTGARMFAAGYVAYVLPGTALKTYFDAVMALSDRAKVAWAESEYKLGVTMPLNADVKINIEGKMKKLQNVDAVNYLQLGGEINI